MATRPSIVTDETTPPHVVLGCAACAACQPKLCEAVARATRSLLDHVAVELPQSVHLITARRVVHWGEDLQGVVPVICEGWGASVATLSDGSRQILSILLPGDMVSMAFLFDADAECTVEAITDVRYRAFARNDLKARLLADADSFARFLNASVEEKGRADQLIADLGRRTAEERIARLILDLKSRLRRRGMLQTETLEMEFPLRRHHIADATGLSPVHVSKVMADLRQNGIVKISDRSLRVLDRDRLRQIALV
jgi:CRP/FNR family transcriptional regulator, anaerobic regulatory protein